MVVLRLRLSILAENPERMRGNTEQSSFMLAMNREVFTLRMYKIKLPFRIKKPILALGTQTKNTVCFAKDGFAYLSPMHPNLNNPGDLLSFEKTVKYLLKKRPKIIAYDLHPEYVSTKYACQLSHACPASPAGGRQAGAIGYQLSAVQHHHAHIASCMVENGLGNQRVIGVAFDGTGLGSDNHLWGAEFLICNYRDYKRAAHLQEIHLLGGEKAILEPARIAAAWLYLLYKDKCFNLDSGWLKKMGGEKLRVLKNMYLSGFNSPLASSMGRLFDAVGSMVLGKSKANFEAELAIELERIAILAESAAGGEGESASFGSYPFKIIHRKDGHILDPAPIFREIIKDLKAGKPAEKIAYRFHMTIAEMIKKTCLILRKEDKTNKVVLSGGVFQNKLLLRLALDLLYEEDFKVFTHKGLSCNDSGISLGEVAIASFWS